MTPERRAAETANLSGYLICIRVSDDRWWPQSFFYYEAQALEYVDFIKSQNPRIEVYVWTPWYHGWSLRGNEAAQ